MNYEVRIIGKEDKFHCSDQQSILHGMSRLGKKGIPDGCHGGGCGVCKIQIIEGNYISKVMSRAHISDEDQNNNIVLACKVIPQSDLLVKVVGKLIKHFSSK